MEHFCAVEDGYSFSFHVPRTFHNYTLAEQSHNGNIKTFDSSDGSPSVVIKRFANPFASIKRAQLIHRELNLLRNLRHENIVRLITSYTAQDESNSEESIYHSTEYCGETLSKKIEQGQYSMEYAKKWIRELLRAIYYLTINRVAHRNIHPGIICIDFNNKLRLTDFGMDIDRGKEGTNTLYMPLEQLLEWRSADGEKVDVWSVSALLCELITGRPLFENHKNTILQQIEYCGSIDLDVLNTMASDNERSALMEKSYRIERKDFIEILRVTMMPERGINRADLVENEDTLRDFIENTLQFNPHRRMSVGEALSHDFLLPLGDLPSEPALPADEKRAMLALRQRITREIEAAPVGR